MTNFEMLSARPSEWLVDSVAELLCDDCEATFVDVFGMNCFDVPGSCESCQFRNAATAAEWLLVEVGGEKQDADES